jgi:sugar/nucleoside kinase (ribokinase family)
VFENFTPHLPEAHKQSPFVLLANIAPSLQHHVLDQMSRTKLVVADTMDLWLNIALDDLLRLLRRVDAFVLNDSEAHQLTQEDNVFAAMRSIHRLGPRYVIIKRARMARFSPAPRDSLSARLTRCTASWIPPGQVIRLWGG